MTSRRRRRTFDESADVRDRQADQGGNDVATMEAKRNGVDTGQLFGTLDLLKEQPALGQFRFRARNRWIQGAHNRTTIKDFYAAGAEDTSRSEAFEIDAG